MIEFEERTMYYKRNQLDLNTINKVTQSCTNFVMHKIIVVCKIINMNQNYKKSKLNANSVYI